MSDDQNQGLNPVDLASMATPAGRVAKVGSQVTNLVGKRVAVWAIAAIGAPIAGFLFFFFFFLFLGVIIVAIVVLIMGGTGAIGASSAEAATGTCTGLKEDYCQIITGKDAPCSGRLKDLFQRAGAWAKVPAGVLVGVAALEGPQIFRYTDKEIEDYSADSGGSGIDGQGIDPANSTPNECGAIGPMQFLIDRDSDYPSWTDTCENPAAATTNTWTGSGDPTRYKDAVSISGSASLDNPDARNIRNAIYGAAWKIKCDSMASTDPLEECESGKFSVFDYNDDTTEWEELEINSAMTSYYGQCDTPAKGDMTYCEYVQWIYEQVSDSGTQCAAGLGDWPTSGHVSQGPYECGEGKTHCPGSKEQQASSIDIDAPKGTPVFATVSGTITNVKSDDYGGLYVAITDDKYRYYYVHLDSYSDCAVKDQEVKAGELIGYVGNSGATHGLYHLHYMIRDAEIGGDNEIPEDEFRNLLPNPNVQVGDDVTTTYSGINCTP